MLRGLDKALRATYIYVHHLICLSPSFSSISHLGYPAKTTKGRLLAVEVFEQKKRQKLRKKVDPTADDPNSLMEWLEGLGNLFGGGMFLG